MKTTSNHILVTGGAGYVGSELVPCLLNKGYEVTVFDLYIYGNDVFDEYKNNPKLHEIKGDIRDKKAFKNAVDGCDCVIHLACISNDPSFELNPTLGKSINYDAFEPLVDISKKQGVKRFIYASSSSVYGIKKEQKVTEDLKLEPLTDYSKYKAMCEKVLQKYNSDEFVTCSVRPSTVCGYGKRQRLDVVVNILTNHAYHNGRIKLFGGTQQRPNIHIKDMVRLYLFLLEQEDEKISNQVYNAGDENHSLFEIAEIIKGEIKKDLPVDVVPTDDPRSYRVTSEKIKGELGFELKYGVKDAVCDLIKAFDEGKLPNSFEDEKYFNIKTMQKIDLT
jgi:nucleoside-diphosphate-sugar epimerase